MKKNILMTVLAVAMIFVLCACSASPFMGANEISKLTEKYGTPKATLVIEYTRDSNNIKIEADYDLLLDKAPISVINFINLANSGAYNNTIIDGRISSATSSWICGRYAYDSEADVKYSELSRDKYIKGEFVQNGWVLPAENEDEEDGNAKFEMMSLAMYHALTVDEFDMSTGAFFITLGNKTESYKNFAVFAQVTSVKVTCNGDVISEGVKTLPASVVADFGNMTSTSTKYFDADKTVSHSVLSNIIKVSVSIKDAGKYSDLPTNYVIAK